MRKSGDLIVIDTPAPEINAPHGVRPTLGTESGVTYKVGDVVYFDIKFTKPVEVSSRVMLKLSTGNKAEYYSGDGTDTVVFKY